MRALMLDNRMFDNGSIECKTFVIAFPDSYVYATWSYVKKSYPLAVKQILKAIEDGKHHISLTSACGNWEIQWD